MVVVSAIASAIAPDEGAKQVLESRGEKRRPKRAALLFACLLASVAAIVYLWLEVWPETVRREAYLPALEAMAQRSPYDGRLQALVGARQIESHEYPKAAQSLRQAIAAGQTQARVWLGLAASLDANGERKRALANMRIAMQARPKDAELQAALGRVAQVPVPIPVGGLAPALLPEGPQPLIAELTQGSFLNELARWWGRHHPESSGYSTRALWVKEDPKSAQAQLLWGLALLENRRPQDAEAPLRQAVALAPHLSEAHLALASLQEKSGRIAPAALEYIATLKIDRNNLAALLGLGRTSQNSGHIGHAVRSFQRATQVAPASSEAWIGLGRATQLTGLGYDKSAAAYAKAKEVAPGNTDFFNDYAVSLYRMSRQSEAEALLRQRLAAAPQDALSHHLLGMVLMNFQPTPERIAEAEQQTRQALRLNKDNPVSGVQLAQLLSQERKSPAETISLLKNAIGHDPYNRNSLLLLARVYRRAGRADLAAKAAAQGATLFKNQQKIADLGDKERKNQLSPTDRVELARLYELTGDSNNARRQRNILSIIKTDPQAPERIERAYNDSVDQVLGKAQSVVEQN